MKYPINIWHGSHCPKQDQQGSKGGGVLRPLTKAPMEKLRVSPVGIVPKKAQGEFCLIHYLSFLGGTSINDAVPSELHMISAPN